MKVSLSPSIYKIMCVTEMVMIELTVLTCITVMFQIYGCKKTIIFTKYLITLSIEGRNAKPSSISLWNSTSIHKYNFRRWLIVQLELLKLLSTNILVVLGENLAEIELIFSPRISSINTRKNITSTLNQKRIFLLS